MAGGIIQKDGIFPVPLPKGVNVNEDEFAVDPRYECVDVRNVSLSFNGLRVRNGETGYINKAYNNISSGIRAMHRYRTSTGTKKIVLNTGIYVYGDSDNGDFDLLTTTLQNGDGYLDFEQYRDSLCISSELADPQWYNASASPATISPTLEPINFTQGVGLLQANNATAGGFLLDKKYVWRVTFDIKIGSDFLGETQAAGVKTSSPPGLTAFNNHSADWSGGTGNDNKVDFLRPSDAVVNAVPTYVDRVNFYRSPPLEVLPILGIGATISVEDTNLYRIGSVSMATIRAAAAASVIFTDDGSVPLGPETPQISYGVRWFPIRARYTTMHKGHMWKTYCNVSPNATAAAYSLDVDGVYYSRLVSNGTEPIVYQSAAPKIQIDPYSGEGNTGMISWRNDILLVFKPRSTHAIIGGDESISQTLPLVRRELLSSTIGCIAPYTIVQAEGSIMWVSHRGVELFNGTGIIPLNSEKIKPLLDEIPAGRRRKMVAYYDSKDREYVIFWTRFSHLIANRMALRYSFITKEWTIDEYPRGVGSVLEVNDSDLPRRLLYGLDDLSTFFDSFSNDPVIVYGKSLYKNATADASPLDWSVAFPYHSMGDNLADKTLHEVSVEGSWTGPVKVAFRATGPNGLIDTTASPIDMGAPTGGRGCMKRPVPNLQVQGKRIQVVLSGQTTDTETNITGVYLHMGAPIGRA